MSKPLLVSAKKLHGFHNEIGASLRTAFGLDRNRHLICEKYAEVPDRRTYDTYRIRDTSSHAARARNLRGNDIDVFPILTTRDETIFVGVSFVWAKSGEKYRFSTSQLIFFVGDLRTNQDLANVLSAKQLMRLEWEGCSEAGKFEALVAAHPHWQIDAMPDKQPAVPSMPETVNLEDLASFSRPQPAAKRWFSRLHLPAAAVGWHVAAGWLGDHDNCIAHANPPTSTDALRSWTLSAARYLTHQLEHAASS